MSEPSKRNNLLLTAGCFAILALLAYLFVYKDAEIASKNSVAPQNLESTRADLNDGIDEKRSPEADHSLAQNTIHDKSVVNQISERPSAEKRSQKDTNELAIEAIDYSNIESLLDNVNDPAVQAYIEQLPPEAQESFYVAALKQSVSKRLDAVEEAGSVTGDTQVLFDDIDTLAAHGVMMPSEVESLKSYIQKRL